MPKLSEIALVEDVFTQNRFLEQALVLEPDYPAAHAMLAWCFHTRFHRGGHSEEDRAAAVRHARRAQGRRA